jgi:hypothetical protein
MPIEIREIVIQAKIDDDLGQEAVDSELNVEALKAEVIAECAEMIRRALERVGER